MLIRASLAHLVCRRKLIRFRSPLGGCLHTLPSPCHDPIAAVTTSRHSADRANRCGESSVVRSENKSSPVPAKEHVPSSCNTRAGTSTLKRLPQQGCVSPSGAGCFFRPLKDKYTITFRNCSTTAGNTRASADDKVADSSLDKTAERTRIFKKPDTAESMDIEQAQIAVGAVQTYFVTKRDPLFISSYELMVQKESTRDPEEWMSFVNHLISNRVFVVEDRTGKCVGNIEKLYYDPGTTEPYRGELNASFQDGKATVSFVLWEGKKIVCSEVYKDVPCSSITVVEACAALLFKCMEWKINNLVMWTDNEAILEAVSGVLTIKSTNSDREVLLLLGYIRRQFDKLVCLRKLLELMSQPSFSPAGKQIFSRSLGDCHQKSEDSRVFVEQDEIEQDFVSKHCMCSIGDSKLLAEKVTEAIKENQMILDKSRLKLKFDSEWKPLLAPRFLILQKNLNDPSTHFVHEQYLLANKRSPNYVSAYELTVHSERIIDPEERDKFAEKLINSRVFVVLDWDSNIGNIETVYYDRGIKELDDVSELYKGEIDASFKNGLATVSAIIWEKDKIISSEVFKHLKCATIHAAEAHAALALFFKCFEQGIEQLVLWTDNGDIHEAISGALTVSKDREDHDLLMLLGRISVKFKKLISMHKRREQLFLADYLTRYPEKPIFMEVVMKKWDYELRGKAIFRLSNCSETTRALKNLKVETYKRPVQTKCFMEVNDLSKLEVVSIIKDTLHPGPMFLAINHMEKPKDFLSQVEVIAGSYSISKTEMDDCSLLHFRGDLGGRELLIVIDATIPEESYGHLDCFTILLVAPGERALLDSKIEEASPLTYFYFRGVMKRRTEAGKK